jgi:HEAT repeat protein
MAPYLRSIVLLILTTAAAEAQGNLSEVFSIIRKEGPAISEANRTRTFEILRRYSTGESLAGEWQILNEALSDPKPFVRDQACAILATIVYLNSARPVDLPDTTKELVLQRFGEAIPNLRENAVRVLALMAGGVPAGIEPQLLRMARTDPASSVRRMAILALASIRTPNPEITEFWVQSLRAEQDKPLRGMVLSAFRFYAQTDPAVISLVIDALRDKDYFVRQEAIAAVVKIGKPAASALPLLIEIRDAQVSDERDEVMRTNAEAAIRVLAEPANR